MTEQSDFLQAVRAQPDDDSPRLAYQQWLVQNTTPPNPRAEFIKVQIDYATAQREGPKYVLYDLSEREDELLKSNSNAWDPEIQQYANKLQYHRGFVELVEVTGQEFLKCANILTSLAPIRHFDLTDVDDIFDQLMASPLLATVRSLCFKNCDLHDRHIELLAQSEHLGELVWLGLEGNNITLDGADALARSSKVPNLAFVDFHKNPVNPVEQCSHDLGHVADTWMTEDGILLERRHGYVPWLHIFAQTIHELIPSRFIFKGAPTP